MPHPQMNLCFYTDQTLSGMTGGIGRITSVMTDVFRRQYGWRVFSIYAFDAKPDCVLTEVDGAIRLRLHDRLGLSHRIRANYPLAADFIRQHHIDVVIIQTSLDVVAKLRRTLDRQGLQHVKVLSVLHFAPGKDEWPWQGGGLKGLLAPVRNAFIHWATVRAYRTAYDAGERVVLLSGHYIDEYRTYASLPQTDRLLAIPNCLSFAETITPAERSQKQPIALVVARMEDMQKRISLILRMWQQVERQGSDWQLQLVGDGPSLGRYRQLAHELGLRQVSFEGRQNPIPYYKRASLFLMTSSFEGFPMTLVEAAQFGCVPVVYDSFSSLGDVVTDGQNGFVVRDGDEEAFTRRMLQLMHDPDLLGRMQQQAIDYCGRFAQETVCDTWRQLLTTL